MNNTSGFVCAAANEQTARKQATSRVMARRERDEPSCLAMDVNAKNDE
jgi:hypothetical protein